MFFSKQNISWKIGLCYVWISFSVSYPRLTDRKCSSLHQQERSPWNVKDDINRCLWREKDWTKDGRWKRVGIEKKSIEKIENDRKSFIQLAVWQGKKKFLLLKKCWKSHKGAPWCIMVQNSQASLLRYNSISFCLALKVLFWGLVENSAYLSATLSPNSFVMFYICLYKRPRYVH